MTVTDIQSLGDLQFLVGRQIFIQILQGKDIYSNTIGEHLGWEEDRRGRMVVPGLYKELGFWDLMDQQNL